MDRPRYTVRGWFRCVLLEGVQSIRMAMWRRRNRKIVRIIENVIGERECASLHGTEANPGHDTYDSGWCSCAVLLRGRLRHHGYLPNVRPDAGREKGSPS